MANSRDYPVPGARFKCGCVDPLTGEWIKGRGAVGNDDVICIWWKGWRKGSGRSECSRDRWARLNIVVTNPNLRASEG